MTSFRRRQDHDDRPGRRRRWLRPGVLVPAGAVCAVLLTVGLVLFEPWTLFVDDVVDEALSVSTAAEPAAGTDGAGSGAATATATATAGSDAGSDADAGADAGAADAEGAAKSAKGRATGAAPAPAGPVTLLKGRFISHEHGTSGSVKVLKLEDGSRVLRIEGLDTSNGPDLRVWLADAPVRKGRAGWFVFDDGTHTDLGALKGNIGNQNYAVPADADLDALRSVSIWCARFRVSFGAAALA